MSLAIIVATVQPGDFVYFAIGPGKDDFYADSTQLDVTITPTAVSDHKLFIPLVARQRSLFRPPVLASPGDENWSDEFGLPWLNAPVLALADDGAGGVYLGGEFTGDFSYITRWDGHQPHNLGSGLNGRVRALTVDAAGNLYAGGSFTTAGGVAAQHIARWDGIAWHPLGSGINGDVLALATDAAGNVYAGGAFTTAGGVAASYIARWDGAWAPLGAGMAGGMYPYVYALALDAAGQLVAGGAFTAADGIGAAGLARWNGSAWSGLGAGLTGGPVRSLAVTKMGEVLDEGYAGIWRTSLGDASGGERLVSFGDYSGMTVHDVEWLPDGSGFLFSLFYVPMDFACNIFRYDFATDEITQLTDLPVSDEQVIGPNQLSISPDGQQVVFEYVADTFDTDSSLWLMNINGSDLRKLRDDAGRPALGRTPQVVPQEETYIPLIAR